jgi:uncharacterized membrane protein YdcZ (DUF606 family)
MRLAQVYLPRNESHSGTFAISSQCHSGIILADPQGIFNCERSHCNSRKCALLIILVIGLLALAKQLAKSLNLILIPI